jgi:hypothetical protein
MKRESMSLYTDYGHTKAKSLIICGPNSNLNLKSILIWDVAIKQGYIHRGNRCDCGRTYIFRYLNPISTRGANSVHHWRGRT